MAYNRTKANLGQAFERLIERTNKQYQLKNRALISKIPTPLKPVRKGDKFIGAFYDKKSGVDFQGVYNGRAIAFDAKSTKETTRFPLDNVADHQIQFLKQWQDQGGISFLLIEFAKRREVYYISFNQLEKWVKQAAEGGRKSIPYEYFLENCELVKSRNGILLDYLYRIERRLVS